MLWVCVMIIIYQPEESNNVAGLVISCSPLPAEARNMADNWGTTPNSHSPICKLALIEMQVVQYHTMWRWSTAKYHNWTSCFFAFYFPPSVDVLRIWRCFFLLSIVILIALCLFLLLLSDCTVKFGLFAALLCKSYHIIT